MRRPLHILNGVLFVLLLPAVGFAYFVEDIYKTIKRVQNGSAEKSLIHTLRVIIHSPFTRSRG
jgi:hypothetical protein